MQTGKKRSSHKGTDWARVKREAALETPVAFTPDSEPYDPNDARAVSAYWKGATIKRGHGRPAARQNVRH